VSWAGWCGRVGLVVFLCVTAARSAQAVPRALYVVDAEGKKPRVLFADATWANPGSPAFSPDGRRLAFDVKKDDETFSATRIFVIPAQGGSWTDLGPGAMPSWSADGNQIAFSHPQEGGVWVMNSDGTGREKVADGWGIQWSPDGKWLAYTVPGNIAVREVATGKTRLLWPEGRSPFRSVRWNMTWSPDSRRIAFTAQPADADGTTRVWELAVVDVDDPQHGLVRLYRARRMGADLAWHPKGDRLLVPLFDQVLKTMLLFELDPRRPGGEPKPVAGLELFARCSGPAWSPDGRKLVFVSSGRRTTAVASARTKRLRPAGRTPRPEGLTKKDWFLLLNAVFLLLAAVVVAALNWKR